MTNVYGTPEKAQRKKRLFQIGMETLEAHGYKIERVSGSGKSSVRRITKGGESKIVTIRTTQDQAIAFPRLQDDSGWKTLDEVQMVIAVSVDDKKDPKNGLVHFLDGDDMRDRFNRAYKARIDAGRSIPLGRGVWLGLYRNEEDGDNVRFVGAGAGLENKPVATVPLEPIDAVDWEGKKGQVAAKGLTISEAKHLLAISLGVDEESIKIVVEA
ncbi:MAG: hypothetical protein K0U72_11870 [Gammaproteobacteria bacterium]|nr:hypothetical protein [Gammaproteobacteria bacterium]